MKALLLTISITVTRHLCLINGIPDPQICLYVGGAPLNTDTMFIHSEGIGDSGYDVMPEPDGHFLKGIGPRRTGTNWYYVRLGYHDTNGVLFWLTELTQEAPLICHPFIPPPLDWECPEDIYHTEITP